MGEPRIEPPTVTALSYWSPPRTIDSAWREHAPFGSWLIGASRPRTVVELGTHNGLSFFTMAAAVQRLGLATRLFAIDSWEGDDQAGHYGNEVYDSVRRIAEEEFPDSTELIKSYFADAVDRFDDASIDLLHIDGRHGYEDVKEDYEAYLPKVSARGVVIFHDTYEFQEGFGVHRFWDEISGSAPSFRFHHGHGLGVLAVGSEAPAEVLEFLAVANREPERVRSDYAAIGARFSRERDERLALHAEIVELRSQLDAARAEAGQSKADAAGLSDQLAALRSSTSWRLTRPVRYIGGIGQR